MAIRNEQRSFIIYFVFGLLVVSECYIYIPPENTGNTFDFTLVDRNGDPTTNGTGLLLARDVTNDGPQGTVCNDWFTNEAANVICKEMGYACATNWGSGSSSSYFSDMDIVIDNILCADSDLPFTNCSYNSHHNCEHNEDISLRCEHVCGFKFELVDIDGARTTENSGLLIATEVNSGLVSEKRGTVCDDDFDEEAALLICRLIGHSCAANWEKRTDWDVQQQFDIVLDDVTCSGRGNQSFSESCTWQTVSDCSHEEDIHLSCGCLTEEYDFFTVDENGKTKEGGGLLMAKAKGSSGKDVIGTVCDDGFTEIAANTICKDMGFTCSISWESAGESRAGGWAERQDIGLADVNCQEDSTGKTQCFYSVDPYCDHSEDVFLYCGSEAECTQPRRVNKNKRKKNKNKKRVDAVSRRD